MPATNSNRPVILAINDEELALQVRKAVLEASGYSVLTALERDRALDLFKTHDIDLVFTDYLLRSSNGADISRELKQIKPNVPIVLLSGMTEQPDDIGEADLFLTKLSGPQELLSVISRMLNHHRAA